MSKVRYFEITAQIAIESDDDVRVSEIKEGLQEPAFRITGSDVEYFKLLTVKQV